MVAQPGSEMKNRLYKICLKSIKSLMFFFVFLTVSIVQHISAAAQDDIKVEGDQLSVSVNGLPVNQVLQEIAAKTGMVFDVKSDLEREITVKFSNMPLVEGLKRILSPDSFVFEYGKATDSSPSKITKVIVYGTGSGTGTKISAPAGQKRASTDDPGPGPKRVAQQEEEPEAEQSLKDYGELLKDPDPELREEAISDMVDDYGIEALPLLEKALVGDGNDEVRVAAASAIGGLEEERGIASLAKGLSDTDEDVRMAIVEALGEISSLAILPVLERAAKDSNEEVKEAANYLIEELKE